MAQDTTSPDTLAESLQTIIGRWRAENPRANKVPRIVRKEINRAVRDDQRRQLLDHQRTRLNIETVIRDHQHNMLVGYRPRIAETPDAWFARQQQLARERLAIEQRISAEPRLPEQDRGQAVTALSAAHHAPSAPLLPVFTQPATGLQALRARVQASLARLRAGLVTGKQQRRIEQWEQLHRERAEHAQRPPDRTATDAAEALGLTSNHSAAASRTTAADGESRITELEKTVAELRASNERLTQKATELAGERDQLAAQLDGVVQQWLDTPSQPGAANPVADKSNTVGQRSGPGLPGAQGQAQPAGSGATTAGLIGAAHPNAGIPLPQQKPATTVPANTGHVAAGVSADNGRDI